MESFYHGKKEIEFWGLTGEILGQNKYTETKVSTSGGGGYVGQHGGHVAAPQVHSTTVTNHEFWIRTQDGREKSVKLSGHNIPLREGQLITLISAGRKDKNGGYYTVLVNHNAGRHWSINDSGRLNQLLKIDRASGKSVIIAGGLWWLVAQIPDMYAYRFQWLVAQLPAIGGDFFFSAQMLNIQLGALVAGAFIVYRLATKIPRIMRMEKTLNQHIESLAQAAYSAT